MKIMAVSDVVANSLYTSDVGQRHNGVDLLIGCGDAPFFYLEFLTSALNTRLVYVRGNHDTGLQYTSNGRVLTYPRGGINLHRRLIEIDGLLIAGLEGSMRYRPNADGMFTDREMYWNIWQLVPSLMWCKMRRGRALDILVTHSPPFGIHDQSDVAHRGFRSFHSLMQYFQPRYLLHGHIHVYRRDKPGITQFHETTVINVYPYHVLEFGL